MVVINDMLFDVSDGNSISYFISASPFYNNLLYITVNVNDIFHSKFIKDTN